MHAGTDLVETGLFGGDPASGISISAPTQSWSACRGRPARTGPRPSEGPGRPVLPPTARAGAPWAGPPLADGPLTQEGPGQGHRQAPDLVRVRLLPDCCQSREASFARAVFTMLTY